MNTPAPQPTDEQWFEAIQLLADHAKNPILDRLGVQVCQEYLNQIPPEKRAEITAPIFNVLATVFRGPQSNN